MASIHGINVLPVAFSVVKAASDNLNVQTVGFVLFSFFRSFIFGVSFSFLPTLVDGSIYWVSRGASPVVVLMLLFSNVW